MTHGTKGAYDRHKCRCDACRAANTAYQRRRRAEKREREAARARRMMLSPLSLEAA